MARIIIIEGPDNSGKSELIKDICKFNNIKLLKFDKKNEDGQLFKIISRNEIKIFETMLEYLDNSIVYILDRGYLSNVIYEKILRNIDSTIYFNDLIRLNKNHTVLHINLTRNKIKIDFEDDLLKITNEQFNNIIDEYNNMYDNSYKFIIHDEYNNIISIDHKIRNECIKKIKKFIKE